MKRKTILEVYNEILALGNHFQEEYKRICEYKGRDKDYDALQSADLCGRIYMYCASLLEDTEEINPSK